MPALSILNAVGIYPKVSENFEGSKIPSASLQVTPVFAKTGQEKDEEDSARLSVRISILNNQDDLIPNSPSAAESQKIPPSAVRVRLELADSPQTP